MTFYDKVIKPISHSELLLKQSLNEN